MTPWRIGASLMTSRRLGVFLCLVGFIWGLTLMNMTLIGYNSENESEHIKGEILQLSEKYVKNLAKETENTIDGPYSGRLTGYDMKKTMAVLLQNIMDRLTKLEQRVEQAMQNHSMSPHAIEGDIAAVRADVKQLQISGGEKQAPDANKNVNGNKLDGPVDAKGLIMGAQEKCELNEDEAKKFQHCRGKIGWMKTMWKSDPCYKDYGVDGTDCSFRMYLSEVENWCPRIHGRVQNKTVMQPVIKLASVNLNMTSLMGKLQDVGQRKNYQWMRMRISRLWNRWEKAAKNLQQKGGLSNRKQKKVLVHLGLLTKQSGFKIAEGSFKGGPLGELVQWSDIIASLFILGHDLTITSEVEQLQAAVIKIEEPGLQSMCTPGVGRPLDLIYSDIVGLKQFKRLTKRISDDEYSAVIKSEGPGFRSNCPSEVGRGLDLIYTDIVGLKQFKHFNKRNNMVKYRILSRFPSAESLCQSRDKLPIDMIFTDIVGLTQFKRKVKHGYGKFSCILRIIDSFGTEPAFNHEAYAKQHHMKTQWGMQNLNPQQFFTMFPHSPDNSFMGFVVENHIDPSVTDIPKKNQAVVYGKAQYMWTGKDAYLNIIKDFVDIHGTVFVDSPKEKLTIPQYVRNHGIMKGPELHQLLRESKLFIGLGFPYEGPAPLEAIAQGCVFINPRFSPPHSSVHTRFFKGKPTRRKITSQHPYVEEFIGEPHVYTVDISNPTQVRQALENALKAHNESKISPYLPYEYTEEGMLERLNVYLEHQDFCSPFLPDWPPASSLSVHVAEAGRSCKDVCMQHRLICEPAHFKYINNKETLEKHFGSCPSSGKADDIYFPGFDPVKKQCILQNQNLLFSCVGEHTSYSRLCPCRNFIEGQTALCKDCVKNRTQTT